MGKFEFVNYMRYVISAVLLIAGIIKIVMPDNLIEVFIFFGMVNQTLATVIIYTIAVIEMAIAILLLRRIQLRKTSALALGICSLYLFISFVGYYFQWGNTCGCLREFTFGKFDSAMLLRNLSLVLIAGIIFKKSGQEINSDRSRH